jgi:hypothetical protein
MRIRDALQRNVTRRVPASIPETATKPANPMLKARRFKRREERKKGERISKFPRLRDWRRSRPRPSRGERIRIKKSPVNRKARIYDQHRRDPIF